jgi:hypothetical protein
MSGAMERKQKYYSSVTKANIGQNCIPVKREYQLIIRG